MRIYNDSHYPLFIADCWVKHGDYIDITENIFDTIHIYSDIGSAEITCEYGERFIKRFGKIVVQESNELDSNNRKCIIVGKISNEN